MFRKISDRFRYRHCREIGVDADYCIVQFRYKDRGWASVGTCHPTAIAAFKRDDVKAHAELLRLSSGAA